MSKHIHLEIDQIVVIFLENESMESGIMGCVKSFNNERVTLVDAYDYETGEKCDTQYMYINKSDIKLVKFLSSKYNSHNDCEVGNPSKINAFNKNMHLTNSIENHFRKLLINFKFIDKKDDGYDSAIKDIWEQHVICLVINDNIIIPNTEESIITITTEQQVYIFDTKVLGKCFDLCEIFAAYKPKKIVYRANAIVEQLKNCSNITLKSVFDLYTGFQSQIPDFGNLDLISCINRYLKPPPDLRPNYIAKLRIRPLSHGDKLNAVKISILHYYLHQVFVQNMLRLNFYEKCSIFSTYYVNKTKVSEVADNLFNQDREVAAEFLNV